LSHGSPFKREKLARQKIGMQSGVVRIAARTTKGMTLRKNLFKMENAESKE